MHFISADGTGFLKTFARAACTELGNVVAIEGFSDVCFRTRFLAKRDNTTRGTPEETHVLFVVRLANCARR
jgi:hypothetical protein